MFKANNFQRCFNLKCHEQFDQQNYLLKIVYYSLKQNLQNLFIFKISLRSIEMFSLKLRQNRNDSIESKKIPVWNLPHFFPCHVGDEKER